MATSQGLEQEAGTRELILRTALRAFSDDGYDGTSIRDIVHEAGVNHGLVRYYFGSKDRLWKEAVDRAFADLSAGLDAVMQDESIGSDRERLGRLIRGHVRFVASHPEWVRLMHSEGKRRGPRMRWIVDRHVKPLYEVLSTLFERVGVGGRLSGAHPIHSFYLVAGSVGVIFHQAEECKRLSGIDPFEASVVEEHARLVEELLLGPAMEDQAR